MYPVARRLSSWDGRGSRRVMDMLHHTRAPDGTRIAWQSLGRGPAVLLVHGFLSSAQMNWIGPGTAAAIAEAGFRVLLPDLRGHGLSDAPEDARFYPPDVLAADLEQVLADARARDCHLVGYSLGARTAVRLLVRGLKPQKLVLGGMGLGGVLSLATRQDFFIRAIEQRETLRRGDAGYEVARFLKSTGTNPQAAIHVLRSQVASMMENLSALTTPTLVICGDRDQDNGSAADLAAALPHARYAEIPGDHMSAVVSKNLGLEIIGFLRGA